MCQPLSFLSAWAANARTRELKIRLKNFNEDFIKKFDFSEKLSYNFNN